MYGIRLLALVILAIAVPASVEARQYCSVYKDCSQCASAAFKQWTEASSLCGKTESPTKCREDLLRWHAQAKASCAKQAQEIACQSCDLMSNGARNSNGCFVKANAAKQGVNCTEGECRRAVQATAAICTKHCTICREGLEPTIE